MSTVDIFDTTLRDGEQTPGLSFDLGQKIQIAKSLEELGISVIEAGFPASSQEESRVVREITEEVAVPTCALARIRTPDIEEALTTGAAMIHIFASTSKIQIEKSMNMTKEEVLQKSVEAVELVKSEGGQCMFSPMDATRTDTSYLFDICQAVEEADVDILNLPDTVGISKPTAMEALVRKVSDRVGVPISTHCHNDFGLAVANTLAAVRGGASQVQVTVNGLGERAGNASLEETVMALECLEGYSTPVNDNLLFQTSKLLERISGIQIPPTKPIVGNNAFSHESGIHAAGVIEDKNTFEPEMMTPEMIGHRRRFVVGKHAGRQGLKKVLTDSGLDPTQGEVEAILEKAKKVSNKGKSLTEADIYAIARTEMDSPPQGDNLVEIDQVFVMSGDKATPTATIKARVRGQEKTEAATGVGPVDAACQAFQSLIGEEKVVEIVEFHMDAITGGSDAMANVVVRVEDDHGNTAEASGTREDIVLASIEALRNAINHLARKTPGNDLPDPDHGKAAVRE